MDTQLPVVELQPLEVDALDAFAVWLAASGAPPDVLELLAGPTRFKLYQGTKEVLPDDTPHLVNVIIKGVTKIRWMECKHCQSEHVVKDGKNGSGSQRYLCRTCARHFTPQPNRIGYDDAMKLTAVGSMSIVV